MNNRRIVALVLAAVMLVMLAGCGNAAAQKPTEAQSTEGQPEVMQTIPPVVETAPPTEPPVEVAMEKYTLSYSGALKDVLQWKERSDGGLAFTVKLDSGEYPVFTMYFESDQGDIVIMLDGGEGKIPVAFQMDTIPENLEGEEASTFYAAQEAVNEVVASLSVKQ